MQQITKQTTGTFDVVNRQSGHVVGTVTILNGRFIDFTPIVLPAVMQSSEQPTEQATTQVDDKTAHGASCSCDACMAADERLFTVWHTPAE